MNRGVSIPRRLLGPLLALIVTTVVGTIGYVLIEHWSVDDALYMTIITIATIGYGEVRPLTPNGRHFTIVLIFAGILGISYTISIITGLIVEGHFSRTWELRRMERRVARVSDHFIVCGFGRVGRQIVSELRRENVPFIVIDVNQASLELAAAEGMIVVYGNATDDVILHEAGIERARGLIAAVADDADNIFVSLSARALRPDMPIVARANQDDSVHKLMLAGATRVVSPYSMAGQQMAHLAIRPAAVDFVETLLRGEGGALLLEEVVVADGAPLIGGTIAELRARFADGVTFAAVQRAGTLLAPPPEALALQSGDVLALVGTGEHLRAVELACEPASRARL